MHLQEFMLWRRALQTNVRCELVLIDLCRGKHLSAILLTLLLDEAQSYVTSGGNPPTITVNWNDLWRKARIPERTGRRHLTDLQRLGYVRLTTQHFGRGRGSLTTVKLIGPAIMEAVNAALRGEAPKYTEDGAE